MLNPLQAVIGNGMSTIVVQLGLPLLVTILFMCALRPVARGLELIDRPGGRKRHVGDVPVIGGFAMTMGLLVASSFSASSVTGFPFFLSGLLTLVVIGGLDDRYDLPPAVRFLAQMCSALLMVAGAGIFVSDLGDVFFNGPVNLGWFSVPFTVLIVLSAINAFNMFDGSDGIAGAQALVALLFLGAAGIAAGATSHLPLIAALTGCVLGFLVFNWPSKRTANMRSFMGDAGSTMLGFSLAWISVELSQGESRAISPVVILWIFTLPLFDLFSSMIRRVWRRQSPFHGDSEHLHHTLKRRGLSSRRVAQVVLAAAAIAAGIGVAGYWVGLPDGCLFLCWLVAGCIYHYAFGTRRGIEAVHALGDELAVSSELSSATGPD